MGGFVGNAGEVATPALLGNLLGKAPAAIRRELPALEGANPKVTGGAGAVMGGVAGYRRGGIPGGIEGALVGGTLGAGVPKSLLALKSLTAAAPEVAAAAGAESSSVLSATDKADMLRKGYSADTIATIEAKLGAKASTPVAVPTPGPKPKFSDWPINAGPADSPPSTLFGYQKDRIQAMRDAIQAGKAGEGAAAAEAAQPGFQRYKEASYTQSKQQLDQVEEARQMALHPPARTYLGPGPEDKALQDALEADTPGQGPAIMANPSAGSRPEFGTNYGTGYNPKIQALRDAVPSGSSLVQRLRGTNMAENANLDELPISVPPRPSSDLMNAYLKHASGPVPAGTKWYGGEGEVIGHTTDVNGSTGLAPLETAAPGTAHEAEYGMSFPNDTTPMSSPVSAADALAERIAALRAANIQRVFGGRQ